jgi:hypothetical protein
MRLRIRVRYSPNEIYEHNSNVLCTQSPSTTHRPRFRCIHESLPLSLPERESTEVRRILRALLGCAIRGGYL